MRKVIRGQETEFKYERGLQPAPKLGEWVEVLTEIVEQEAKLPRRGRRSTQRLFEELRGRGCDGAHDSVHRFAKASEQVVKDIRRATRTHFSAEEKIRIMLDGLRGEDSIAALCRREGNVQDLYYRWSKEFLKARKKRLAGDTARAATSDDGHASLSPRTTC